MSFLRHRETHQADEQLKSSDLLNERARPFGHALAHPADESPVGYSWRVALQHCPLPLHQPRLIVSNRSVKGNNSFRPGDGVAELFVSLMGCVPQGGWRREECGARSLSHLVIAPPTQGGW